MKPTITIIQLDNGRYRIEVNGKEFPFNASFESLRGAFEELHYYNHIDAASLLEGPKVINVDDLKKNA